jgi:hypothetical protein
MRYPYDLFVKFLITRKADVNRTLVSLGLPELSDGESLTKNVLASNLPPSVATFIDDPPGSPDKGEAFLRWSEAHGMRELWEIQPEFLHTSLRTLTKGSGAMKKACDLFANHSKRTALSLLLMREFPPEDIVDTFSEHFDTEIDQEVIALAKRYFFDFSEMSPTDWHSLFHNLPPEERDKLQIGREPHSKEFVEYSIGKMPSLTYEEILNDVMVTSYYKFKALADQPLMDTMAQRWATMAMVAGEKKIKFTKGDRKDLNEDIQLRFEFSDQEFPTLAELSTGSKS